MRLHAQRSVCSALLLFIHCSVRVTFTGSNRSCCGKILQALTSTHIGIVRLGRRLPNGRSQVRTSNNHYYSDVDLMFFSSHRPKILSSIRTTRKISHFPASPGFFVLTSFCFICTWYSPTQPGTQRCRKRSLSPISSVKPRLETLGKARLFHYRHPGLSDSDSSHNCHTESCSDWNQGRDIE